MVGAAALAVGWFVLGYAFYAGLFACAGALVPRQEELQSSMTPLTMLILISFFVSFVVLDDPDGTLAHVTLVHPVQRADHDAAADRARRGAGLRDRRSRSRSPRPSRAALIPLAGRIYSGAVLRTGSAVKVRDAWRASRARRPRLEGELLGAEGAGQRDARSPRRRTSAASTGSRRGSRLVVVGAASLAAASSSSTCVSCARTAVGHARRGCRRLA